MCSKYIYRSEWVHRFWLVKPLSCIVEGGQKYSKNQSKMPLCAHLGQQSNIDNYMYSYMYMYLPQKFSSSRRVNCRVLLGYYLGTTWVLLGYYLGITRVLLGYY